MTQIDSAKLSTAIRRCCPVQNLDQIMRCCSSNQGLPLTGLCQVSHITKIVFHTRRYLVNTLKFTPHESWLVSVHCWALQKRTFVSGLGLSKFLLKVKGHFELSLSA